MCLDGQNKNCYINQTVWLNRQSKHPYLNPSKSLDLKNIYLCKFYKVFGTLWASLWAQILRGVWNLIFTPVSTNFTRCLEPYVTPGSTNFTRCLEPSIYPCEHKFPNFQGFSVFDIPHHHHQFISSSTNNTLMYISKSDYPPTHSPINKEKSQVPQDQFVCGDLQTLHPALILTWYGTHTTYNIREWLNYVFHGDGCATG